MLAKKPVHTAARSVGTGRSLEWCCLATEELVHIGFRGALKPGWSLHRTPAARNVHLILTLSVGPNQVDISYVTSHNGERNKGLVSRICPQILLCKKKILITSKCRHMHEVLNVDEIKN
jgi:hypothetical protein